jgi:hypothetical protein
LRATSTTILKSKRKRDHRGLPSLHATTDPVFDAVPRDTRCSGRLWIRNMTFWHCRGTPVALCYHPHQMLRNRSCCGKAFLKWHNRVIVIAGKSCFMTQVLTLTNSGECCDSPVRNGREFRNFKHKGVEMHQEYSHSEGRH